MLNRVVPALLVALVATSSLSAQVLVNELDTGGDDAVEFFNVGMDRGRPRRLARRERRDRSGLHVDHRDVHDPVAGGRARGWVLHRARELGRPGAGRHPRLRRPAEHPWPTAGPGSRGGDCVLVDGATNTGVDMVIWNDPPGANNFFGATFVGTLSALGSTLRRASNVDTDTGSDWAFGGLNLGAVNPGQVDPTQPILEVTVMTDGFGSIQWDVTSSNPPLPGGELFNLVSFQDFAPDGAGPFFGIGFDAIPQLASPKSSVGPFHTCLDASGNFSFSLPTGTVPRACTWSSSASR